MPCSYPDEEEEEEDDSDDNDDDDDASLDILLNLSDSESDIKDNAALTSRSRDFAEIDMNESLNDVIVTADESGEIKQDLLLIGTRRKGVRLRENYAI